jgi:hypothetical protein
MVLFAFVVEILVEHLIGKPLEQSSPMTPRWWLIYVSLVLGAALGWFAEVNAFEGLVPVLVGRIVMSLLVGGGSQIVHAVVNKARDPLAGVFEV